MAKRYGLETDLIGHGGTPISNYIGVYFEDYSWTVRVYVDGVFHYISGIDSDMLAGEIRDVAVKSSKHKRTRNLNFPTSSKTAVRYWELHLEGLRGAAIREQIRIEAELEALQAEQEMNEDDEE